MDNKSLYFELFAIVLLLITGTMLLLSGLPGWGLITIAGILSALSLGLRKAVLATNDKKQPSASLSSNSLASKKQATHSFVSEAV